MPEINIKIGKYGLSTGIGGGQGAFFKLSSLPMATSYAGTRYGSLGRAWFAGLLPGSQKDYARIAGDAWKNGVVSAALSWISRNLPYAPLAVYEEDAQGEEKIVAKHPLAQLLKKPNDFYDGKTLMQATFLSLIAGRGNAYWWVKRSNSGKPLAFWYLPHFDVWPVWNANSTTDTWIEGYGYKHNGQVTYLSNEEVIHFRDGLDPENPRSGWDALKAGAREIVVDNAASGWAAQLLENMAVPGLMISPKGENRFSPDSMQEMKAYYETMMGGDNRFRPLVLDGEVVVDKLSFTPEEMSLPTMQDRPEARLLAMIGLSPMVLGLTVGLEHSTYSNMETAEKAAWYNCIMPRIALICSELDTQALSYYPGAENLFLSGDYRKVPSLQDNLSEKYQRLSLAVGGKAFLTQNEARQQLGLLPMDGLDEISDPAEEVEDKQGANDKTPQKATKDWVTINGTHIFIDENGHAQGNSPAARAINEGHADKPASGKKPASESKPDTEKPKTHTGAGKEQKPTDAARVERAKSSATRIGADEQRYSEEHNEPMLAKAVGGLSLRDNEPIDIMVVKEGIVKHGIELKTMLSNKADKITMKREALDRKAAWVEKNHAHFHTVVFDDKQAFNANGAGKHDHSKREIYYKRGAGSFRISSMHKVGSVEELNTLMDTPSAELPKAAQPPASYAEPKARKSWDAIYR